MLKKFLLLLCLPFLAYGDLQKDIDQATKIVQDFRKLPEENSIPEKVLQKAKGIAILSLIKAGFLVSGKGGNGVVLAQNRTGWSAPSAITLGGAGLGLLIGGEASEIILILNDQKAVEAFMKNSNFILGSDVSAVAGPSGTALQGSKFPNASIYSYSYSKGAFAGVSLEGSMVFARDEANEKFYGYKVTPKELLSGKIPAPFKAFALYQELENYR